MTSLATGLSTAEGNAGCDFYTKYYIASIRNHSHTGVADQYSHLSTSVSGN